jgi:hypothetical protein
MLVDILNRVIQMGSENQAIYELLRNAVQDTKNNRAILFWKDPVPVSFSSITAYTIIGNGMKIVCDDTAQRNKVIDTITAFNNQINVGRQTIDDVFTRSITDNNTQAFSIWRLLYTDDSQSGIDMARVDPLTVEKGADDKKGWEGYVQKPYTRFGTYASQNAFYNALKNTPIGIGSQFTVPASAMPLPTNIVIPNDPRFLMEFEFYERPPISTVLDGLLYKQWILWYMKMYSDRYWSPFKVGYVGDPKTIFPEDPTEMAKQVEDLLMSLLHMRNFGSMVTAGYNHVEEFGKNSAASSEVYPGFINMLDKQTMYALSGSMGQRDAAGNELAVSRILEQGWLRTNIGLRTRFSRAWTDFYINNLLPFNGIHGVTHQQLHLSFSPMEQISILDMMKAIEIGMKNVVFKHVNEPRAIMHEIWDNIADVDEAMAKKMQSDFMDLNKKPEPAAFGGAGAAK